MDISTHTTLSNVDSEPGVSMGDVSTLGVRNDPRSRMSMGPLGASTLSMRAKSARKRQINAQHNSNFRAGYVPVEEEALHKTGIRGRKRYFLWCFLVILMIVAILNVAVTAWLLYILGMTHIGMTSVEMTSIGGREFLRVLAEAEIISMSFNDAPLGARHKSDLVVETQDAFLEIFARSGNNKSSIKLEENNITITTDEFSIKVNKSNDWLSFSLPSLAEHNAIDNLIVDGSVIASQIYGVTNIRDLYLESPVGRVDTAASEGINLTSYKEFDIRGDHVTLDSKNSIIMTTKHGIYFDPRLPRVTTSDPINPDLLTFKVCVCESGQMFTVPVTRPGVSCDLGAQLQKVCGPSV